MSSTIESKSARDTREHPTNNSRVSSFDVRPSVAGMIADSEGNLDEKKTVAALSQTHNANKYLWTGSFVLIGVVLLLIAANIGISVVVARLTRQINVDPVTGMASIPGSDDVVMKTSEARYHEEDLNFHHVPTKYLSAMKTVEFNDGDLSFDVKGYARMSNETILLVEGGSLVFDINGFKNITGDKLTRLFSSISDDKESTDPDGRRLCYRGGGAIGALICTLTSGSSSTSTESATAVLSADCFACNAYSYEVRIRNGVPNVASTCCDFQESGAWAGSKCRCSGEPGDKTPCYELTSSYNPSRCGRYISFMEYSCPEHLPYCNEANFWCGNTLAHRDAQASTQYDYYPHCSF